MTARERSRSLTQRTLWRVAIRISVVVALATIVSYWNVRSGLEDQALEQLASYVEQRQARESAIFELASDHLGRVRRKLPPAPRAAQSGAAERQVQRAVRAPRGRHHPAA